MDRLKRAARAVYLAAQKVLVPCCLFLAYIFGVGAMAALDRVFHFQPGQEALKNSFWKEAARDTDGIKDAAEQS